MLRIMLLSLLAYSYSQAQIKVLFLGDSITAGYGLSVDDAYPALVEAKLMGQIKSINAGISGDTTAGGLGRVTWLLKRHNPEVLFIALGANDGLRGFPVETMKANLQKIITAATEHNKEIQIILAGIRLPPTMGKEYTTTFTKSFEGVALKTEVVLHKNLLREVAGNKKLNLPDGIHPNKEGQKLIAVAVAETINPLLPQ